MTFGSLDDLQSSYGDYSASSSSLPPLHSNNNNSSTPGPPAPTPSQHRFPHQGSLCRVEGGLEVTYVLPIRVNDSTVHELQFSRADFEFALRLFSILDTESRGQIKKQVAHEFVTLRCPVFWRRDDDLRRGKSKKSSPTFDEAWLAVATCSMPPPNGPQTELDVLTEGDSDDEGDDLFSSSYQEDVDLDSVELGVEGWLVFCRFVALAQYLEAKRRFSGRHLQQTMRHRNSPRGSELVMVDVPPAAPPIPLTALQLANYERESNKPLPLPELDLDHSLLAAHDVLRRRRKEVLGGRGKVKIDLFGAPTSLNLGSSASSTDFCLTFFRTPDAHQHHDSSFTVRRSTNDFKWLNETLVSHKTLGGTLCGRILPPFPGKLQSPLYQDDSSLGSTGEALAAAATAGVGISKAGFKSLWGSYVASAPNLDPTSKSNTKAKGNVSLPESYYNPNSPACKARQLERFLNYLMEHPALSTSFPLNTILLASQSGLEAAKQSLEEHARAAREIKEQTPTMEDGKMANLWTMQSSSGSQQPNLSWVRTAAQAAVALQLHGVLETTGLPSASARLQHASLPTFDNSHNSAWNNDEGEIPLRNDSDTTAETDDGQHSFEEGVEQVQDGLESEEFEEDNSGYDLLPLPVPPPERKILSVSNKDARSPDSSEHREVRFRYGALTPQEAVLAVDYEDGKPAYIGEMVVDANIDKLREVIGSVDTTLSRCMASSATIGKARRQSLALHLEVIRGLDSWVGLRGRFVAQRALLKGVSGIEQSRDVFEESDLELIDDVSWQTALAHSAVSAAEDVRSTVRASRTASNAKSAASSAATSARKACETRKFASIDEARAAQTRASIAQSHAIHSAVVEHEAKTVKRRATLALAHDVKCWNAHRKREILQTALTYAKSQHEATRRAVDAWSCLRDGYVGSTTIIPSTQARRPPPLPEPQQSPESIRDEVQAMIYTADQDESEKRPTIVAVDHELLKQSGESSSSSSGGDIFSPAEPETILPLVVASPIAEEDEDLARSRIFDDIGASSHSRLRSSGSMHGMASGIQSQHLGNSTILGKSVAEAEEIEENEAMTSSMQSLVDGLMNWGGQYDEDEDLTLPTGMAASIALEESGVLGSHHKHL